MKLWHGFLAVIVVFAALLPFLSEGHAKPTNYISKNTFAEGKKGVGDHEYLNSTSLGEVCTKACEHSTHNAKIGIAVGNIGTPAKLAVVTTFVVCFAVTGGLTIFWIVRPD